MERERTHCFACNYTHLWNAYKWVGDQDRADWNKSRSTVCTKCGSTDVRVLRDEERRPPYPREAPK